jgi:Protein of unknown function (DUF1295)
VEGYWTIFSPILMTFLLMKVSGVALLEQKLSETKPKYKEYTEKTSAFFPMIPKGNYSLLSIILSISFIFKTLTVACAMFVLA